MSLNGSIIDRVKEVNAQDELLASGFVRSYSLMEVPFEIIQICIAFLLCIDEWDTNNKSKHLKYQESIMKSWNVPIQHM